MTNIQECFDIGMLIEIEFKMEYQTPYSNNSRSYFETLDY
jgi:hypothetical protein